MCCCGICDVKLIPRELDKPVHFEFDHVDVFAKTGNVGKMIMSLAPFSDIKGEIDKCRILCHHCHSLVTQIQLEAGVFQLHSLYDIKPRLKILVQEKVEKWVKNHLSN